jgi:aminoglycoside 3-N-acetyltransferase I
MKNKFQIRRLEKQDVVLFQQLILLFQELFEMKKTSIPEETYLIQLLTNPDFIVYAIITEDEIIGGLTAYELASYYSKGSEIFIYDIAIKSTFQRKGLGKQLLLSLKEYSKQKGINAIFVDANEEDDHAVDFYHSTGGRADKVIQFTYYTN